MQAEIEKLKALLAHMRSMNVVSYGLKPRIFEGWKNDLEQIINSLQSQNTPATSEPAKVA